MNAGALCLGFSGHAWVVVGPIFVLTEQHGARRITLHCERCDSWGYDTWAKETGARLKPRRYQRAKGYQAYLADHDRNTARLEIMSGKKEVKDGVHHPGLRLVPKAATAKGRRHQSHARQRKA